MLRTILIVGTGGFIGSVMRYLVQVFVELAEKGNLMSAEWRIFLAVGICGGFTTFSSFAYNNLMLLKENAFGQLFWNVGGSLFFSILAVYLGIILVRAILG